MNFKEELAILEKETANLHIMVLGDLMLDRYMIGTANRISPEAPVPVILWNRTEDKLGGASNVAANLKAMGCKVSIMGLCGTDENARILENQLKEIGCDHIFLIRDQLRPTTVKTRIVAEHHQIARVDQENVDPMNESLQNECLDMLQKFFSENRLDVLIFQDYNKGFLHGAWISKIIKLASDAGIKTAVDPKKENFFEYSGVDLFKPNLREAIQAIEFRYKDLSDLSSLSKILRDKLLCNKLMITLASEGIWIDNGTTAERHKTKARKVADVSGAGDTVICLAAICQACSLSDLFMAACCNAGGGQVCEKFGVVPLKKEELIHELLD